MCAQFLLCLYWLDFIHRIYMLSLVKDFLVEYLFRKNFSSK